MILRTLSCYCMAECDANTVILINLDKIKQLNFRPFRAVT